MLYAQEGLEDALGMQFREPTKAVVQRTQEIVQRLADFLGRTAPAIGVPPKGFLQIPLSAQDKEVLNMSIGPEYARRNAEQQDQLRRVPIHECGQRMVSLPDVLQNRGAEALFSQQGFHEACASWAGTPRVTYLREDVAHKIAEVFRALNQVNIIPSVEDCWRHYLVQRGLLVRRMIGIARAFSEWEWNQVRTVAMSFTAPAPGLAGHQAGAAIDWRLFDMRTRQPLPLGNEYAQGGVVSSLDFPYLQEDEWATRTIFSAASEMGGMKKLLTEDWHTSHGDRGMGTDDSVTMGTAIFGPIVDFNRDTGVIQPYEANLIEGYYLTNEQCERLVARCREKIGGKYSVDERELYREFNPEGGWIAIV